jgi:outer membrane receptor protein involved in Fe transport
MKRTLLYLALLNTCLSHAASIELDTITVTSTREGQALSKTPQAISKISGEDIDKLKSQHASQVMNQAAGVWVNVTGGEGHLTAIRQPITTSPVYLYLEDGIPTRSTGFFNHNALYEVNIPQASGVEITKGPGTALYGSDAIGGVINVQTKEPSYEPSAQISLEGGSFGWARALISTSASHNKDGLRADLNLTRTDGWRDHTAYDRQSATLRWDRNLSQSRLKTVLTATQVDQDTAGSSAISASDYHHNPKVSYTPISYRKVSALRLSSAYDYEDGNALYSITPYARDNSMELLANWSLGYDPTVYQTGNQSYGLLSKARFDFAPLQSRVIAGLDIDYSPGDRKEDAIAVTTEGSGYTRRYTGFNLAGRAYDYDATFKSISPYVHSELSATDALRLTVGLRFDYMAYDYRNNLNAGVVNLNGRNYYRPANAKLDYSHLSPKIGATYDLGHKQSLYAAYNHAFRTPSEGQLFRPGASSNAAALVQNTLDLKPIKADSFELGYRGALGERVAYSLSLYRMIKRDDIISQKNPNTNETQAVNAGKTLHQGLELGINTLLLQQLTLGISYSYAKHSYEDWLAGSTDFSGNEMENAPREIANTRLTYTPFGESGLRTSLEWQHIGSYWLNADNTQKYSGHDLVNWRANQPLGKAWSVYGSINNLADVRFAESAGLSSGNPTYAPGLPRSYFLGLEYQFGHE